MLCRPAFRTLTCLGIYFVCLVLTTAVATNNLKETLQLLGYVLCFYLFTILCVFGLTYFEDGKERCEVTTATYCDSDGSTDIELSYYPTKTPVYTTPVTITIVNEEDNDKLEDVGENVGMVDGKVDMVDGEHDADDNGGNGGEDNGEHDADDNGGEDDAEIDFEIDFETDGEDEDE